MLLPQGTWIPHAMPHGQTIGGWSGERQATAFVNRFKGLGSLTLVQEVEFTTLVEIFVTIPAWLLSQGLGFPRRPSCPTLTILILKHDENLSFENFRLYLNSQCLSGVQDQKKQN